MKYLRWNVVLTAALVALPMMSYAGLAYTSKPANLRAGPAAEYPVVAIIQGGTSISVEGCQSDYEWCDVLVGPYRGWMYAGNIAYPYQGANVPVMEMGAALGIGITAFSLGSYWDRHYHTTPWYPQRQYWIERPRSQFSRGDHSPPPPYGVREGHRPPPPPPPHQIRTDDHRPPSMPPHRAGTGDHRPPPPARGPGTGDHRPPAAPAPGAGTGGQKPPSTGPGAGSGEHRPPTSPGPGAGSGGHKPPPAAPGAGPEAGSGGKNRPPAAPGAGSGAGSGSGKPPPPAAPATGTQNPSKGKEPGTRPKPEDGKPGTR